MVSKLAKDWFPGFLFRIFIINSRFGNRMNTIRGYNKNIEFIKEATIAIAVTGFD